MAHGRGLYNIFFRTKKQIIIKKEYVPNMYTFIA